MICDLRLLIANTNTGDSFALPAGAKFKRIQAEEDFRQIRELENDEYTYALKVNLLRK